MKVLFLDIDGVLNHDHTVERTPQNYLGLDAELVKRYLSWLEGKDISVVLSSAWRNFKELRDHLNDNGIFFIAQTPRAFSMERRADEIQDWLDEIAEPVTTFAILDDNDFFSPTPLAEYFVQTYHKVGVTDENLKKVDEILNG